MKTVIATVIETNEYEIKLDVENDATEDEIKDIMKLTLDAMSVSPDAEI